MGYYPVDAFAIGMKGIKLKNKHDHSHEQQAERHADGQTEDVENSEEFIFGKIPGGGFKVVPENGSGGMNALQDAAGRLFCSPGGLAHGLVLQRDVWKVVMLHQWA